MKSGTVSLDELSKAEKVLGVKFVDDYKEFVQKYGGAVVGPFPIYGLRHAGPMDDNLWSVVDVTMRYRNEGWPETQKLYIVSSDHADNPIAITKDGRMVSYDHDFGGMVDIAESFECFVLQCLEQRRLRQ